MQRYGLEYPFLMDRQATVFNRYGVLSTPTTYFISPDGLIVDRTVGVVSQGWLERNIERYISG